MQQQKFKLKQVDLKLTTSDRTQKSRASKAKNDIQQVILNRTKAKQLQNLCKFKEQQGFKLKEILNRCMLLEKYRMLMNLEIGPDITGYRTQKSRASKFKKL